MSNRTKLISLHGLGTYNDMHPQVKPINKTWAELSALKTGGKLIPGQLYRITDYVATTTAEDTQSAGHPFDIIVMAIDTRTLGEHALAAQHEGDEYFAGCNLSAWELKYAIDNDPERFGWADAQNGKGVVYYMRDEFGNECPYDFKNIMFKRYYSDTFSAYLLMAAWSGYETIEGKESIYVYTFSSDPLDGIEDQSLDGYNYNNIIHPYSSAYRVQLLNNIVFFNASYNNTIGFGCHDCSFAGPNENNVIGNECQCNITSDLRHNRIGPYCKDNVFYGRMAANEIGAYFVSNKCYSIVRNNRFGTNFEQNIVGDGRLITVNNTFGDNITESTFTATQNSTFGSGLHKVYLNGHFNEMIIYGGNENLSVGGSPNTTYSGIVVEDVAIGGTTIKSLLVGDDDITFRNANRQYIDIE